MESDDRTRIWTEDSSSQDEYLNDLMPFIQAGTVIPIVSNSFRLEQIFREENELLNRITNDRVEFDDEDQTIDEQLTKKWAASIGYPMMDDHNLARVAQYYQVEQNDSEKAKAKYLRFLRECLLRINLDSSSSDHAEFASGALRQVQQIQFSSIVKGLDYPRFPDTVEDPLRLLARLPLKIYITTSYFDFLERALEDEGKKPQTLVCFWSGGMSKASPIHVKLQNPDIALTEKTPLVYHLFGLENYPQTIVLSEDDFINFLVSVFEDTNNLNPIVPTFLKEALAEQRLILFGYHLKDWDFRVLFKFIMKFRRGPEDEIPKGILIQLKPNLKGMGNEKKSIEYLERYFGKKQFDVDWTSAEKFIYELLSAWKLYTGTVNHE